MPFISGVSISKKNNVNRLSQGNIQPIHTGKSRQMRPRRIDTIHIRFEEKDENYVALVQFACAVIVFRKLFPVHQS